MYSIILLLLRVSTSESMIPGPDFQSTVYIFVLYSCIKEDWDTNHTLVPLSCPLALKRIGTLLHFCFDTLNLHPLNQPSCSINLFGA